MARLGDICTVSSSNALIPDNRIWLLNLDMVEQQTGNIISYNYVGNDGLNGSIIQFDTDNVLYSKLRPNLNKVVIPDRGGFATSEMLPLKPNASVLCREYLAAYLRSDSFVSWAVSKTAGAKMPRLGTKVLLNKEIPLPPLEEQRRIAARLDKVSDLIAKRRAQLDKLDLLVKARFVEMFGDCYTNPYNLPIAKWNDVFNTTTGKLDSNASVENGEYPFFTCSKEILRIDKYAFDQEALLLAGNNAAGKYDVKYYKGKFNAYQRTYVLSLKQNWSYALFRFQLEDKLGYLEQQSLGGLTKYLTLKILNELEFIIPGKLEQDKFATFVKQIEKSKLMIQQSLDKLEILKKALMQQYFG